MGIVTLGAAAGLRQPVGAAAGALHRAAARDLDLPRHGRRPRTPGPPVPGREPRPRGRGRGSGSLIAATCSGGLLGLLAGSCELPSPWLPTGACWRSRGPSPSSPVRWWASRPRCRAARGAINPALKQPRGRGSRRLGHALVAARVAIFDGARSRRHAVHRDTGHAESRGSGISIRRRGPGSHPQEPASLFQPRLENDRGDADSTASGHFPVFHHRALCDGCRLPAISGSAPFRSKGINRAPTSGTRSRST